MKKKADGYNRQIAFGLRIHVIVRKTELEAKKYAKNSKNIFQVLTDD